MANMFEMMKKAAALKKQMKHMQDELARKTATGSSGPVTVVARGDMSIKSISIPPEDLQRLAPEKLEKMLVNAANSALESAKKMAGAEMAKMPGGLNGLKDMLG